MREANELDRDELAAIVQSIQKFLYLDENEPGAKTWDLEKPCSGGDLFDYVTRLFDLYGLMPEEPQPAGGPPPPAGHAAREPGKAFTQVARPLTGSQKSLFAITS